MDPLVEETLEPYGYAGANVVNDKDPSGELHLGGGGEICNPSIPSECILPTTSQQRCQQLLQDNGLDPFTQGYCNPAYPVNNDVYWILGGILALPVVVAGSEAVLGGAAAGCAAVEAPTIVATAAPAATAAAATVGEVINDDGGDNNVAGATDGAATVIEGLTSAEQASLTRLEQLPEFAGRTFSASPNPGQDWIDNLGNTYDQMGDPAASEYWNTQSENFLNQIDMHLAKADFVVLDMTGFTRSQIATVTQYVDSLPESSQNRIVRLGF